MNDVVHKCFVSKAIFFWGKNATILWCEELSNILDILFKTKQKKKNILLKNSKLINNVTPYYNFFLIKKSKQ